MEQTRAQLFSRTAFSLNQYRELRSRNGFESALYGLHLGCPAEQDPSGRAVTSSFVMGGCAEKHGVSCPPWFRNLAHIAKRLILQSVLGRARLLPNGSFRRGGKNPSKVC